MKRYTFIAEYRGGTYISQYNAINLHCAIELWGNNLIKKIFSKAKRQKILEEINGGEEIPMPIKGVKNVWCCCYLSGKYFLLLNIIETTTDNE